MLAGWISAVATAIATVNGILQWRRRRNDGRRFGEVKTQFAQVHERITNGGSSAGSPG